MSSSDANKKESEKEAEKKLIAIGVDAKFRLTNQTTRAFRSPEFIFWRQSDREKERFHYF